jgi:hypothetical protein
MTVAVKFESEKIDGSRFGTLEECLLALRSRFSGLFDLILPQLAFVEYFSISKTHGQSLNLSFRGG